MLIYNYQRLFAPFLMKQGFIRLMFAKWCNHVECALNTLIQWKDQADFLLHL